MSVKVNNTRVRDTFVLKKTKCALCGRSIRMERMFWVESGPWRKGGRKVFYGCRRCSPIPEVLASIIHNDTK